MTSGIELADHADQDLYINAVNKQLYSSSLDDARGLTASPTDGKQGEDP